MRPKHPTEPPTDENPDYVAVVVEWDALGDDGMTGATTEDMPTQNPDWIVDEASMESFPASDAPGYSASYVVSEESIEELQPRPRRITRKRVLLGVIGLFALTGILAGLKWLRDR